MQKHHAVVTMQLQGTNQPIPVKANDAGAKFLHKLLMVTRYILEFSYCVSFSSPLPIFELL